MPDASEDIDEKIKARRRASSPEKPPLEVATFAEMLEPDLNTRSLVKGILETTAIALIFGESGCGKTFFALDLGLHIALGRDWFGRKVTQGRVAYVAAEAGRSIRNRVAAWAMEKCKGQTDIDFEAVVSPVDLCHLGKGDDIDRLVAAIVTAEVVIIDTVSRALAGGNENAPDDMGAFVAALDRLRDRLGCTIVAVHHVGKDASRGGRGHSLLHCAVDTEIEIQRRDGGVCVATVRKQRDAPCGGQIGFTLKPVELGRDQDWDPVTSCVVEATGHLPPSRYAGPTGQAKLALEVLTRAIIDKGQRHAVRDQWVQAVKVDTWREYMQQSGLFGAEAKDPAAAFRSAWKKVQASLAAGDPPAVVFDPPAGMVWPTEQPF